MKKIILLISIFATSITSGQCITGSQSKMLANSEKKIDSIFNFDYRINSTLEYKREGKVKRFALTYYVNTQDGSMFFPKGILPANNFEDQNEHFRFDSTVWLSNRQMVNYIFDKTNNQKRAMTVSTKKSSTDVFMGQHTEILSFFNDREDLEMAQETPKPLPVEFKWNSITHGYTGDIYFETEKAKMTIYLDEHPTDIKTSTPIVGFLVGVVNFLDEKKCNKLAVFTKIEQENGDYIQEELFSMTKEEKSFNASSYKPFGLLKGVMGTQGNGVRNMKAVMADFQSKAIALGQELQKLQKDKQKCIDTAKGDNSYCSEKYNPLIEANKQQSKQLQYDLMKKMGAEDMMKH
jgi:hypothetical protein